MRIFSKSALLLAVLVSSVNVSAGKEWLDLVPLKSNRVDVERLLGRSSDGVYHHGKKIVYVEYAQFSCGHKNPPSWPEAPPGWNVPIGTVVAIRVSMGIDTVQLESLPYDLTKFERIRGDHDLPLHFYHTNQADGFAIEFFDFGGKEGKVVSAFLYTPTNVEEELFRCKN